MIHRRTDLPPDRSKGHNPDETWKQIPGFEGRYEASNLGRLWSVITSRILSPGLSSNQYLTVTLYDGSRPKKPRSYCVHDLIAAAFLGPKPDGKQVDHVDGNRQNNRATNLEYVTPKVNINRSDERTGGRKRYHGHDNVNSKLSPADVKEIRRLGAIRAEKKRVPRSLTNKTIASVFGVSASTISSVIAGKTYKSP